MNVLRSKIESREDRKEERERERERDRRCRVKTWKRAKPSPCRFLGYPGRYIRRRDRYQNPVVPSTLQPCFELDAVSIRGGIQTQGRRNGDREKESRERTAMEERGGGRWVGGIGGGKGNRQRRKNRPSEEGRKRKTRGKSEKVVFSSYDKSTGLRYPYRTPEPVSTAPGSFRSKNRRVVASPGVRSKKNRN